MAIETDLEKAKRQYREDPSTYNLIWLARRLGYEGEFEKEIKLLSEEIERNPDDPRLYRHRGHRYITVRNFTKAKSDLEIAVSLIKDMEDEIEEDGIPNSKNIPRSTLFFNIYYHLGLVYYLTGNYNVSLGYFRECKAVSNNDDSIVAYTYWIVLILIKLKQNRFEPYLESISTEMDIIENYTYHKLLLFFRGKISETTILENIKLDLDGSTLSYGIAMWHISHNQIKKAKDILQHIVENGIKASFGYIAAEIDLNHIKKEYRFIL